MRVFLGLSAAMLILLVVGAGLVALLSPQEHRPIANCGGGVPVWNEATARYDCRSLIP